MNYLGIDVAKAKLDCALLDPLTDKRKTKSVTNDVSGFKALADWLGKRGVALTEVHAVLEATGVYHEAAALWLADAGVTVSIANPAQVKDFARGLAVRTKTDGGQRGAGALRCADQTAAVADATARDTRTQGLACPAGGAGNGCAA